MTFSRLIGTTTATVLGFGIATTASAQAPSKILPAVQGPCARIPAFRAFEGAPERGCTQQDTAGDASPGGSDEVYARTGRDLCGSAGNARRANEGDSFTGTGTSGDHARPVQGHACVRGSCGS